MRKEELRKLKRIYATPKMVRMAEDNCKKMEYRLLWDEKQTKILQTEFDFLVRCQSRGKYLMICVFDTKWLENGIRHPLYEIYCNPEGDEYITRIMNPDGKENRWSSAMFDNLYHVYYSAYERYWMKETDRERRFWQSPEGRGTIRTHLKTNKNGMYGLVEWQRKIKAKKIEEAEKRQKAPWDADMRLVPAVMPSFEKWMQKEAADKYFIIYEYKGKEPDEGWCSGCRKFVPVAKPRHNKKGKCPKCGKDITFKAAGKIRTLSTDWYRAQCIQKIDGGIVVREFKQYQYYRDTVYTKPKVITHEQRRVLLMDDGTVKRYVYGLYKNKEYRFMPDRYGYTRNERTKLYNSNIAALKKTALKTSSIDMWMRRGRKELPCGTAEYLEAEKGNPAVEKLAKIGMFRLAQEMIHAHYKRVRDIVDQDATELLKILKIDGARLRRLKTMDGGIGHLRWFQLEKMVDRMFPDEMIKDFGDRGINAGDFFGFLTPPLSYVKIWNYMKRQQGMTGDSLKKILQTWKDYINMAEKLKMDVKKEQIWKPKDLKAAHNGAMILLQEGEMEKEAAELEKKWTKVNGILPKLKKFTYADKKFTVLAPESILDIVKEGRILQHCVHTCDFYFDRIEKDETYLFFLRRTGQEDVPWYTLEVEAGGNIRQKRTTGDNQNKDFEEAVPFLQKWQKYFIKQMTEAEKELGKKAEQARRQEYEKLRRDGNRVWHGKLAGHLLADVLEADFMAAVPLEEMAEAGGLLPAT